ncbi:MAG: glutamate racemase [Chloroflexota bacterium]
MSDPRPIGVFDSGVGGLTVLQEIVRRLPSESTIYLGDNGRAPYGTRTDDEVLAFSSESIDALVERDVKAVVVACNTSTAVALQHLRRRHDRPILGVIRPGAAAAALASRNRRVGVIATPATVRSHAYFWAIKDENPAIEVYEHATPALVPLVEGGHLSGPEVDAAIAEALAPLFGERDASGDFVFPLPASARIDTLLLGCTHYPLLRPVIAAAAGERVAIVDSATATASALAELLSVNGLEAPGTTRGTAADAGPRGHEAPGEEVAAPVHVQFTTGDVAAFRGLATQLFGEAFTDVAAIDLTARGRGPANETAPGAAGNDTAMTPAGAGRRRT